MIYPSMIPQLLPSKPTHHFKVLANLWKTILVFFKELATNCTQKDKDSIVDSRPIPQVDPLRLLIIFQTTNCCKQH